jgi:polyisoprenoid-binding protein YceI
MSPNYFYLFLTCLETVISIFVKTLFKIIKIMKRKFFNLFAVVTLIVSATSCKNESKEVKTTEAENVVEAQATSAKYLTNAETSIIEWIGSKPTGSKHNGTINIESGVFTVSDGKLESGTFLIDMNSIVNLDIPADKKGNANLVGHLKSADFFDVEKFPSAAFEVTGLEEVDGKMMLSGNLKMKDIENNITIPVSTISEGNNFTLTSESFTIDRSKWNVKYNSGSFFENLGDKLINDDIELKITVKASKS